MLLPYQHWTKFSVKKKKVTLDALNGGAKVENRVQNGDFICLQEGWKHQVKLFSDGVDGMKIG